MDRESVASFRRDAPALACRRIVRHVAGRRAHRRRAGLLRRQLSAPDRFSGSARRFSRAYRLEPQRAAVERRYRARVSVAALMAPERHAGKRYRPTGLALLSAYDMAAIVAQVLRHRVVALPMPFWMFQRAARLQGVDPFSLASLRYYIREHAAGAFAVDAPTDDVSKRRAVPPKISKRPRVGTPRCHLRDRRLPTSCGRS